MRHALDSCCLDGSPFFQYEPRDGAIHTLCVHNATPRVLYAKYEYGLFTWRYLFKEGVDMHSRSVLFAWSVPQSLYAGKW